MRRMALTYRRESLERTVDRQSNRTAGSYRRNIMTYIDGFVAAVPTANREKFKKHADEAAAIFKEYGALSVVDCWGDDVPEGKITSFSMAVQRKDDETVVFSWIVWPSKEARKAAWDKMMADPRMKPEGNPMPFDGKRMIYGGFEPIISRRENGRPSMNKQGSAGSTATNTIRLHRVLAAKPDKVYRAFTTADAMARWLPPNGFTCTVHEMDSKVGGTYRMSFRNFTTGKTHVFGGKYLDLVPDEFIRYTDRFEDPNLLGEMITTVALQPVSVGTEVNIVQEGLPAAIPIEACYLGWQQSLNHLAMLVEPEIKD